MCASTLLWLGEDPGAPLAPQHHPASPAGEGVPGGLFLLPSLPAGFAHWQDRGQDLAGRQTSEKAELLRFAALQGQLKCAASFYCSLLSTGRGGGWKSSAQCFHQDPQSPLEYLLGASPACFVCRLWVRGVRKTFLTLAAGAGGKAQSPRGTAGEQRA